MGSVTLMTQSTAIKPPAGEPAHRTQWEKLFIGGKWVEPSSAEVIEVHSPATGELVGKVPLAAVVTPEMTNEPALNPPLTPPANLIDSSVRRRVCELVAPVVFPNAD